MDGPGMVLDPGMRQDNRQGRDDIGEGFDGGVGLVVRRDMRTLIPKIHVVQAAEDGHILVLKAADHAHNLVFDAPDGFGDGVTMLDEAQLLRDRAVDRPDEGCRTGKPGLHRNFGGRFQVETMSAGLYVHPFQDGFCQVQPVAARFQVRRPRQFLPVAVIRFQNQGICGENLAAGAFDGRAGDNGTAVHIGRVAKNAAASRRGAYDQQRLLEREWARDFSTGRGPVPARTPLIPRSRRLLGTLSLCSLLKGRRMKKLLILVALLTLLLPPALADDIVAVAAKTPELSTFAKLIEAAGLTETLKGKGPFTVFAPGNAAFEKLPKEKLAELQKPENKDKLKQVLLYHVVAAEYTTDIMEQAPVGTKGPSLAGAELTLTSVNPIMVNEARLVKPDLKADNGVIHIINAVLTAPANDLIAVLSRTPELSTLVKLITAAGLTDTLKGAGPFTILAPTNAAFDKVPKDQLESLAKPENKEKLKTILLGHVASGAYPTEMMAGASVGQGGPSVAGPELTITSLNPIMINDAKITKADIKADNGIVHIVDKVLLPADKPTAKPADTKPADPKPAEKP